MLGSSILADCHLWPHRYRPQPQPPFILLLHEHHLVVVVNYTSLMGTHESAHICIESEFEHTDVNL